MNIRRAFILFFTLVFCTLTVTETYAQQAVGGKITDAKGNPVSFATAVLQQLPDSTFLAAATSDTNGVFALLPVKGKAIITVSMPGYRSVSKMLTGDSLVNFILEDAGRQLSGVTVIAAKPLVEHKVDRTVFNVESSIAAIGSDALEALKKAPGVRVNNNEISIVGKSAVTVTINGRLVQLSGDELAAMLKSIPADQLSKIEVITTPPAKYDAAGNSGIINIVTKKSLRNGLNGNITGTYQRNTLGSVASNGSFNYRSNKWNIYGDGFVNQYHAAPVENYTTFYPGQQWQQDNVQRRTSVFDRCRIGADYNITPRSLIGIAYTLGGGGYFYEYDEDVSTKISNAAGHMDSVLRTKAHTDETGLRNVAELNYEWNIDTSGRKLTAGASYFNRTGDKARTFTTQSFMDNGQPGGLPGTNRTSGRQVVEAKTANVDMEWPTKIAEFSFGGKLSFIHNTSDNMFEYRDTLGYHTDYGKTNYFDYRENTQALYLGAKREFKKWQFQLGLRGEYTQTKGYSPTLNQTNTNDYLKLFPTAYIAYVPGEDHSFNINYSRRIDRPPFWSLNPFRFYTGTNSYSEGNPFLQPSFSTNFELSYTFKSKYTIKAYTQAVNGYRTNVSQVDSVNKGIIFRDENAGKINNYGISVDGSFTPAKWWECTLLANGYYAVFSSDFYSGAASQKYSLPTFFMEINNSFTLNRKRTLLAELGFWYQHKEQDDFDLSTSRSNLRAGIKALFFQKRFIVAINGEDLLRGTAQQLTNQYNGTQTYRYDDEREVSLSLTWKFGSNNAQQRERKSSEEGSRL